MADYKRAVKAKNSSFSLAERCFSPDHASVGSNLRVATSPPGRQNVPGNVWSEREG